MQNLTPWHKRPYLWLDALCLSVLLCWTLGLILHVLTLAPNQDAFVKLMQREPTYFSDFVKYYQAGEISRSDLKSRIYDPAVQLQWNENFLGPGHIKKLNAHQYTPYFCIFMIPFSFLPIEKSYLIWCLLTALAGFLPVIVLMRAYNPLKGFELIFFWAVIGSSLPVWRNILLGQCAFLLLGIFTIFYYAWLRRNNILAGIMLALGTIKPQYTTALFILGLTAKRWQLLAAAVATELSLILGSALVLGWNTILGYPAVIFDQEINAGGQYTGQFSRYMISIRGLLSNIFPESFALHWSFLFTLLGIIVSFIVWRKALRAGSHTFSWALSITIILCLLTSPHSHSYDLVILTLPWALTVKAVGLDKLTSLTNICHRLWCLLFLFYPITIWLITIAFSADVANILHFPTLLVMLWLATAMFYKTAGETSTVATSKG